jgi:putative hydrolase of the HAD superfamily
VERLDLPYDAVLLDAGGVLLLPDPEILRRGLAPFGLRPDDDTCVRAHYESMGEVDRLRGPEWDAVDRVYALAVGVAEEDVDAVLPVIEDLYLNHPFVPVPGAAEALLCLQDAGVALAIVSNATGTVERQLADHRICSVNGGDVARVALVVDSHLVGVENPDPRIFHLALDGLGVASDRSLYVGDTVHFDVEGARAVGMSCVHVDPVGRCRATDHPHTASLIDLVRGLRAA